MYNHNKEDQMEDALVLQQVLFPTVALILVEPRDNLLAQDIHLCELLVTGTTSPQQQSQRKQASEAVSHEWPYVSGPPYNGATIPRTTYNIE